MQTHPVTDVDASALNNEAQYYERDREEKQGFGISLKIRCLKIPISQRHSVLSIPLASRSLQVDKYDVTSM